MINYQKWLAAANGIQLTSWKALKAGIVSTTKAMGVWLTTTPAGWATMAGVAIAGVVLGVNAYNKKQEELREAAIESADALKDQSSDMKELVSHYEEILDLSSEFNFKAQDKSLTNKTNILQGKTFVITGSLEKYNNRDELKSVIESNGGKVSGSVSAKTFALINNDIESSSSKNKKAKSLGVQIINEEQFMQLLN